MRHMPELDADESLVVLKAENRGQVHFQREETSLPPSARMHVAATTLGLDRVLLAQSLNTMDPTALTFPTQSAPGSESGQV